MSASPRWTELPAREADMGRWAGFSDAGERAIREQLAHMRFSSGVPGGDGYHEGAYRYRLGFGEDSRDGGEEAVLQDCWRARAFRPKEKKMEPSSSGSGMPLLCLQEERSGSALFPTAFSSLADEGDGAVVQETVPVHVAITGFTLPGGGGDSAGDEVVGLDLDAGESLRLDLTVGQSLVLLAELRSSEQDTDGASSKWRAETQVCLPMESVLFSSAGNATAPSLDFTVRAPRGKRAGSASLGVRQLLADAVAAQQAPCDVAASDQADEAEALERVSSRGHIHRTVWVETTGDLRGVRLRVTISCGIALVLAGPVRSENDVRWERDATQCALCARQFGFFYRRHHCRVCGRASCAACSDKRAHLEADLTAAERVCKHCHADILFHPKDLQVSLRPLVRWIKARKVEPRVGTGWLFSFRDAEPSIDLQLAPSDAAGGDENDSPYAWFLIQEWGHMLNSEPRVVILDPDDSEKVVPIGTVPSLAVAERLLALCAATARDSNWSAAQAYASVRSGFDFNGHRFTSGALVQSAHRSPLHALLFGSSLGLLADDPAATEERVTARDTDSDSVLAGAQSSHFYSTALSEADATGKFVIVPILLFVDGLVFVPGYRELDFRQRKARTVWFRGKNRVKACIGCGMLPPGNALSGQTFDLFEGDARVMGETRCFGQRAL